MKRKASAEWKGSLKEGKGSVSTESSVLAQAQYYKADPHRGQVILDPAVAVFLNSFSPARTLLVSIVRY